jgi:NADH:ubiquinone oxidoreductase subunit 4 (subunit M)
MRRRNMRRVALWTTVITFLVSLLHLGRVRSRRTPASSSRKAASGWAAIGYHMGVDGISMLFVILTTFLMPLCIWPAGIRPDAREGIHDRVPGARDADDRRVLRARLVCSTCSSKAA